MNDSIPPIPNRQRTIDADHLVLLSIFHFVAVGLALITIFIMIAQLSMFHAFFDNPQMWQNQKQPLPPQEFFAFFKWFWLVFGVWAVILGILNIISGFCLRARKHRTFSIFVGALNCLHVPLGTALGVFTIIVLMRPSVHEMYESSAGTAVARYQ